MLAGQQAAFRPIAPATAAVLAVDRHGTQRRYFCPESLPERVMLESIKSEIGALFFSVPWLLWYTRRYTVLPQQVVSR